MTFSIKLGNTENVKSLQGRLNKLSAVLLIQHFISVRTLTENDATMLKSVNFFYTDDSSEECHNRWQDMVMTLKQKHNHHNRWGHLCWYWKNMPKSLKLGDADSFFSDRNTVPLFVGTFHVITIHSFLFGSNVSLQDGSENKEVWSMYKEIMATAPQQRSYMFETSYLSSGQV